MGLFIGVLTEIQSKIVLVALAVVLVLLIFGVVNTLRRVSELEKVVFRSSEKTAKLHEAVDSIHETSE